MKPLADRIQAANSLLGTYAVPLEGTLGRTHEEKPDETRFPFQRDRDRIIHSRAFRRLKGKTQVFVSGVGDHYRTRLTHTMEVTQIARDMARTLGLNEDLAECIALAHDLGHPPFGHAGEEALNEWMKVHGSSFEHNQQSLRIVTILEEHSALYLGLNLNREVLEGMQKHRSAEGEMERGLSLEAQLVNLADEIAYTGHDCDDGLRAELFTMDDLKSLPLIQKANVISSERGTELRGALIHLLITNAYEETEKRLRESTITTLNQVYKSDKEIVAFSDEMRSDLQELRNFLWQRMYMHPDVKKHADAGQKTIRELCEHLRKNPNEQVLTLQKKHGDQLIESVKDYVAGMTDGYATAMNTQ